MLSSGPLRQCVFMPLVMRKVNMKINRKCLVASAVAVVMILFILLELAKLLKFSSLGGLQSHLITLFFWTTIVSVFACLIHKIDRLELSLKSNIPSREVATKLNYLVVNWFTNHNKQSPDVHPIPAASSGVLRTDSHVLGTFGSVGRSGDSL